MTQTGRYDQGGQRAAPPERAGGPRPAPSDGTASDGTGPRVPDERLAYLLDRATVALTGRFAAELRKRRVPLTTWRVLSVLSDRDGLSIGELATLTLSKQPALTKVVDRLCRRDLVMRRQSDRDYRKVLVFMTPHGREHATDLLACAQQLEHRALAGLDEAELARLKATLQALIKHCSR